MRGRLAALNLPGIGSQSLRQMERANGCLSETFTVWKDQVASFRGKRDSAEELKKAWNLGHWQFEVIQNLNARIICENDHLYPKAFHDLSNPPFLVSVRGDCTLLEKRGIAIVGTREPSERAKIRAYSMGRECAEENRVAVSGLALGCDTYAHRGALNGRGKTIAVLPADLSRVVPKRNEALAREILERGGALVTEVFPKTKLEPYHFVQRNRLIAALSEWILVVEAGLDSGTMHTVKMGRRLNRKVGVVLDGEAGMGEAGQWIFEKNWGRPIQRLTEIL